MIAAWLVLLKSTNENSCLSATACPQSLVNASPCHKAFALIVVSAVKVILSEEVPIAFIAEHVPSARTPPSKEIPMFSPIITSTPASMFKLPSMDRYPLGSLGITLIGLSSKYHDVSPTMLSVTVTP